MLVTHEFPRPEFVNSLVSTSKPASFHLFALGDSGVTKPVAAQKYRSKHPFGTSSLHGELPGKWLKQIDHWHRYLSLILHFTGPATGGEDNGRLHIVRQPKFKGE